LSAELPGELARLIGQHPSAVRSVRFSEDPHESGTLAHLEIETKHGFVTLIDHRSGAVYANPPVLPGVDPDLSRQQRDLSDQLPVAFSGRPRFSAVIPLITDGMLRGWHFVLDTGGAFTLTLDQRLPIVSTTSENPDAAQ
jgi:hypothetical protein